MHRIRRSTDEVHFYMAAQASRIVAASGRPCDRFHIGKHVLQGLKDAPDFLAQIDGGTGESETNQSLLERSLRCAIAFRNFGLKEGDVVIIMAPNHIHLAVTIFAAMCLGITIAVTDDSYSNDELFVKFDLCQPKAIFCQNKRAADVDMILKRCKEDSKVITYDKASNPDTQDFTQFIEVFGDEASVEHFKPSDINPENNVAFLIETSGTTSGKRKDVKITHKNLITAIPYLWMKFPKYPTPTRMQLIVSHPLWITTIASYIFSAILRYTRLQSSTDMTPEHAIYLINTYKPTHMIMTPMFLHKLIQPYVKEKADFTCFEIIVLGGSAVSKNLTAQLKKLCPNTNVYDGYGMSETSIWILDPLDTPIGTCGVFMGHLEYRLIDVDTEEDITEPYQTGELWVKGPGVFKGYFRNPKATEEVFTEDGWFKTGDLLYRDEDWKFYFVERTKLMLKYSFGSKYYRISPTDWEEVIRSHDGVADVAVTGVPEVEGDWPVACVVRRPGACVTADDIKQLVNNNLIDAQQLRGGVIFLDALPTTSSGKVNRKKLFELARAMDKE